MASLRHLARPTKVQRRSSASESAPWKLVPHQERKALLISVRTRKPTAETSRPKTAGLRPVAKRLAGPKKNLAIMATVVAMMVM